MMFCACPQSWSGVLTTILESCLLVGLSSPLSTLMLVYTEVVQLRPTAGVTSIRHLRQTVVSVITGTRRRVINKSSFVKEKIKY